MNSISGIGELLPPGQPSKQSEVTTLEKSFGELLTQNINEVNNSQLRGDMAVQQLHVGNSKNLHGAMIAMEEADISLRFLVQVRNKAMDAYQEIMRMQV